MAARRDDGPRTAASDAAFADRRRQRLALTAIVGLVVAAFGLWAVAITTSGDRQPPEIAAAPPAIDESPTDTADTHDPDADDRGARRERVTLDGVCDVELPESDPDAGPVRAWDHPDCTYAPVPVEERRERWIVVRASMRDGDFDADAAERRATELGVDGGVLWSSHYPSLNPDLWVVYDGPFVDARTARDAADTVAGEAYARQLTTDVGDRYCIAEDGCTGERAD